MATYDIYRTLRGDGRLLLFEDKEEKQVRALMKAIRKYPLWRDPERVKYEVRVHV